MPERESSFRSGQRDTVVEVDLHQDILRENTNAGDLMGTLVKVKTMLTGLHEAMKGVDENNIEYPSLKQQLDLLEKAHEDVKRELNESLARTEGLLDAMRELNKVLEKQKAA